MLKIFGKEFTGSFFENWKVNDGLYSNVLHRIRNSSYTCSNDLYIRCADALNENEVELLKLQKHLKCVIDEKENDISQAESELSVIEESSRFVDEAVNKLLIGRAWRMGYESAEEDLKPNKRVETA